MPTGGFIGVHTGTGLTKAGPKGVLNHKEGVPITPPNKAEAAGVNLQGWTGEGVARAIQQEVVEGHLPRAVVRVTRG